MSEQIEELTKYAMPFNLLAVEEKKRYYVNIQKKSAIAADGDEYYRVWAQGEPNTFNFVSGGCDGDGTNRLLIYAGNGEYLSVCKFASKLSSAE